jgi:hypothetical protein
MRGAAWVLGVFLSVSAMADSDLKPLISHFQQISRQAVTSPKVIALGEEHGRQELRDFYPKMLAALKAANSNFNCVYFELESAVQPSLDEFQDGVIAPAQVMPKGIKAMFDKWDLRGENGYFNWTNSIAATVRNLNVSPELLQIAKKLGFKFLAVDEQSRSDYIASIFQFMIEKYGSEEPARLAMEKAGLSNELPEYPFVYFRDEIVLRRSRKMAEKIAQSIHSGECKGGLFIAGSLHVQRQVPGGRRVYRKGGATAVDVLRENGLATHVISSQIVDGGIRFANVPPAKKGAYFLLTPLNFEHPWPEDSEVQAAILLRKN